VEMRESRTPCPNKPIEEYATGLVDALLYASASHRQDALALALWS
jgi:hypothetical protein